MTTKCASCGSEQLLQRTRLYKTGRLFPGEITLDIPPMGWSGTGQFRSELRAVTCVDCGHVQVHATDLPALRAAYEEQRATSLHVA